MVTCSAIGDPYFGDVIHGIDRVAQKNGFAVLVKEVRSVRWSSAEIRDIILSRAADGIIVLGSISPFDLKDEVDTADPLSAGGGRSGDRLDVHAAAPVGAGSTTSRRPRNSPGTWSGLATAASPS